MHNEKQLLLLPLLFLLVITSSIAVTVNFQAEDLYGTSIAPVNYTVGKGYETGAYYILVEADTVTTSAFTTGTNEIEQIDSKTWKLTNTNADYEVQRAQLLALLFYGTDGTNARLNGTYVQNITTISSNDERDTNKTASYFYIYNSKTNGNPGTKSYEIEFNDKTNNNDVSVWTDATCNGYSDYTSFEMPAFVSAPTNPLQGLGYRETSGDSYGCWGDAETKTQIGTDRSSDEQNNPINAGLRIKVPTVGGNTGTHSVKSIILYEGTYNLTYTDAIGGTDIQENINYSSLGIPVFNYTHQTTTTNLELTTGNYTVLAQKGNWYNKTIQTTIEPTTTTVTVPDMYQTIVNISFINQFDNSSVSAAYELTTVGNSLTGTANSVQWQDIEQKNWSVNALSTGFESVSTSILTTKPIQYVNFTLTESTLWLEFSQTTNITLITTENTSYYEDIQLYINLNQLPTGVITIRWGDGQVAEYYNDGSTVFHADVKVLDNQTELDATRNWDVYLNGNAQENVRILFEQQEASGDWEIVSGKVTDKNGKAAIPLVGGETYRVTATYNTYSAQTLYTVVAGDTETTTIELTEETNYQDDALYTNTTIKLQPSTTYGYQYKCPAQSCQIEETYTINYVNGTTVQYTTERTGTTSIEWERTTPSTFGNITLLVTTTGQQTYTMQWNMEETTPVLNRDQIYGVLKTKPQLALALIFLPLLILVPVVEKKIKKGYGKYAPLAWFTIWTLFAPILGLLVVILFIIQFILPFIKGQQEAS